MNCLKDKTFRFFTYICICCMMFDCRLSKQQVKDLIAAGTIHDNAGAIDRAQKAYFRGNEVGKNQLEQWIIERNLFYNPATYNEILRKVCIFN